MLTRSQLAEFKERGVLVVPSVLDSDQVDKARKGFHSTLKRTYNLENPQSPSSSDVSVSSLASASSTNGAGGILDMFYEDFQLELAETPRVVAILCELWKEVCDTWKESYRPLGTSAINYNQALASVDRVCFRLPDEVALASGGGKKRPMQRHLAPHLDCCPHLAVEKVPNSSTPAPCKWRPIQCFLALTDCLTPTSGGLEVCPGHHKKFATWAANRTPSAGGKQPPCQGEFTPMRPKEDADVISRMEAVLCRAGDLVLWDNRIPHANARSNSSPFPREVVYLKFLPQCELNAAYVNSQQSDLRLRRPPRDFWIGTSPLGGDGSSCDEEETAALTLGPLGPLGPLGRRIFGLCAWERTENVLDFVSPIPS